MSILAKLTVIQFVLLIITTSGKIAFLDMDEYDIRNLDSYFTEFYVLLYKLLRVIYLPQMAIFIGSVLLAVIIGIIEL